MTKAEFWIAYLIDMINAAKKAGVSKETLDKALEMQYDATLSGNGGRRKTPTASTTPIWPVNRSRAR